MTMRHFFAKVAGESYRNADGSDRQAIIASCRVGEPLLLLPEPDNPHDENAIKVLREDGKQIGYLDAGLAARLASEGDGDYHAFIAGVGRGGGGLYGVAVLIVVNAGDASDAATEQYARRVLSKDQTVESRPRPGRQRFTEASGDQRVVITVLVMLALAVLVGAALRFLL
jgi:hypothetical protein